MTVIFPALNSHLPEICDLFDRGNCSYKISKLLNIPIREVKEATDRYKLDPDRMWEHKRSYHTYRYCGQKFGMLTLNMVYYGAQPKIRWVCKCDCGHFIIVKYLDLKSGSITHCGEPDHDLRLKQAKSKKNPVMSTARRVWTKQYKDGCPFELFLALSKLPCVYCGKLNSNKYSAGTKKPMWFIYNGLDRLDSNKNHSPDNIVPCCKTCNWMKLKLSPLEFKIHIANIYNHNFDKWFNTIPMKKSDWDYEVLDVLKAIELIAHNSKSIIGNNTMYEYERIATIIWRLQNMTTDGTKQI